MDYFYKILAGDFNCSQRENGMAAQLLLVEDDSKSRCLRPDFALQRNGSARNARRTEERIVLTGKDAATRKRKAPRGNRGDLPEAGDGKLKLVSAFQRVL